MAKLDYIDFQDKTYPLAYLITFRCYGTWLHGDERGSMDGTNTMSMELQICRNKKLVEDERNELKSPPVSLDERQRAVVERAIREVCDYRGYKLFAINVRTNHVHSVVYARCKPEPVMDAFKAYATRQLRRKGLLNRNVRPWSRHGSTPYLWTEEQLQRAIEYVVSGQDGEPFIK